MYLTKSFSALLVTTLSAVVSALPTTDWKYAVGWDGVVLDPTAIGSPASNNSVRDLEKRTPGGVLLCTDINWGGTCGYAVQPLDVCIDLGSDWFDKISSFGPDPGAICYAYSGNECREASWSFTYPGDATGGLGTSNPWDDQITNFMCE